jgi:hypothetical protein
MTWLLIAYLLVLVYFTVNPGKRGRPGSFRLAWLLFAGIPLSHFFFALVRAGNMRDPRDLALTEVWADGVAWLLLGLSLIFLINAIAPAEENPNRGANFPPPPPTP